MDQAQQQKLHHVRILVRSKAAGPMSSHRQLLGASQIFATHTAMQRKTTDQQRTVFDESIPAVAFQVSTPICDSLPIHQR